MFVLRSVQTHLKLVRLLFCESRTASASVQFIVFEAAQHYHRPAHIRHLAGVSETRKTNLCEFLQMCDSILKHVRYYSLCFIINFISCMDKISRKGHYRLHDRFTLINCYMYVRLTNSSVIAMKKISTRVATQMTSYVARTCKHKSEIVSFPFISHLTIETASLSPLRAMTTTPTSIPQDV
jgi:hypothetical protein